VTPETPVIVHMALDPETLRVLMQDHEFQDGDFPPGLRGVSWPRRQGEVDQDIWDALLAGDLTPDEQDHLHRESWSENGSTPWPT
jgi:hypothetical protein